MKKVILLVMVLLLAFSVVAFADKDDNFQPITGAKVGTGNFGPAIVGGLQAVGYIVAVAVLLYVGIKFMLASPGEKANLKGMLIPYIVGAVLIFAASTVVGLIKDAAFVANDDKDDAYLNPETSYEIVLK